MMDDLCAFAADRQWPRAEFQSKTEEAFAFEMDGRVRISGKVDRIDAAPDGRAYIIDYKYSGKQRTKLRLNDANILQAPLYMMAVRELGLRAAGMFYVALKGGVTYAGWSDGPVGSLTAEAIPENWLARAATRTLEAVDEIRSGRVEPSPADAENCRLCDYRDVCRIGVGASETAAADEEGA
jgi:RecB family exonuclease